jgi:hypothetical protein
VKVARGPGGWARLALLGVVLLGAAVIPGRATSQQAPRCAGLRCTAPGSLLWTSALPGSWIAQSGVSGTVTEPDAAYAADGGGVAVVGSGIEVTGYQVATGKRLWRVALAALPVGSAIVSVRAFSGVVAVGVQPPAGETGAARAEVILSAATGRQIRVYPAAAFGGAVWADTARTVIVGSAAVLAYANSTGRVLWERSIGAGAPAWRAAGRYIYVTEPGTAGGMPPVRQISLMTGAERIVRPRPAAFAGTLAGVIDVPRSGGEPSAAVLMFSGAKGVAAYGLNGEMLWHQDGGVLELADSPQGVVYLAEGSKLTGIEALSGTEVSSVAISIAASLYWVSDGVALGLDQNALGEAWGYSLTGRRVAWTSVALPWPHFFPDLSGLGGSASGAGDVALLAACALVGAAPAAAAAPPCVRPELAAVLIRSRQAG